VFVWKNASEEIANSRPLSSSMIVGEEPLTSSDRPPAVVSPGPSMTVQTTEVASTAAASESVSSSPGEVTTRTCSCPVRRASRRTRLRRKPVWVRRS
jgi:hypothetical protein